MKPIMTPKGITATSNNHGERISVLEQGMRQLSETMKDLATQAQRSHEDLITQIQSNREATHRELTGITQQISKQGRANLPTIFSGIAVALSLGAAVLYPLWSHDADQKQEFKELAADVKRHEQLEVHPGMAVRFNTFENEYHRQVAADRADVAEKVRQLEKQTVMQNEITDLKIKLACQPKGQ